MPVWISHLAFLSCKDFFKSKLRNIIVAKDLAVVL